MTTERRFGAGMAADETDEPGLIQETDGSVWVVDTDGTRTRLPGGGPGGGAAWYDGTGAPAPGLGSDGDYYLDDATGDVYAKAGVWSVVANIKGAQGDPGATGSTGATGAPGSVWREGSGVPSNGLGVDGDYYLDGDTGDVYLRASGTYSVVANIKGPTGPTDYDGGNATSVYGGAIVIDGGNA